MTYTIANDQRERPRVRRMRAIQSDGTRTADAKALTKTRRAQRKLAQSHA